MIKVTIVVDTVRLKPCHNILNIQGYYTPNPINDIYNWIYLPYNGFVLFISCAITSKNFFMMGVYLLMSNQNGVMTKAEAMDNLMDSYKERFSASEILTIIRQVFKLDLESVSELPALPRAALDAYLEQVGNKVTGAEIRKMVNQTFSINLDALSALERAKISLFSKNQWMVRHDNDLFAVHTGAGDIDVRISPTDYFMEQTASKALPADLINALVALGYRREENLGSCYFSNSAGEPVPDAFKGQTMMAIKKVIQQSYSHL